MNRKRLTICLFALAATASNVFALTEARMSGKVIDANTKKAVLSQTASVQIITGAASKQTYICSVIIFSATAQSVNLVEGTGTTCATGIAGLTGGTTAATGMSLAANGSLSRGTGTGLTTFTATSADNVCLLQSSTGQVSGVIIYTQF